MTVRTAVDDEEILPSQCWCCGAIDDPGRLVHLGNHPEVAVCIRCTRSLHKWGRELEDQGRTGLPVRVRDRFRQVRKAVVRRGWQHNRLLGRPLRWIGRFTP